MAFSVLLADGSFWPDVEGISAAIKKVEEGTSGSYICHDGTTVAVSPISDRQRKKLLIEYLPTYKVLLPGGELICGITAPEGAVSAAKSQEGAVIYGVEGKQIAQSPFAPDRELELYREMPDLCMVGD